MYSPHSACCAWSVRASRWLPSFRNQEVDSVVFRLRTKVEKEWGDTDKWEELIVKTCWSGMLTRFGTLAPWREPIVSFDVTRTYDEQTARPGLLSTIGHGLTYCAVLDLTL